MITINFRPLPPTTTTLILAKETPGEPAKAKRKKEEEEEEKEKEVVQSWYPVKLSSSRATCGSYNRKKTQEKNKQMDTCFFSIRAMWFA